MFYNFHRAWLLIIEISYIKTNVQNFMYPLLQNPFGQQRGASQGSETEGHNCSDGTTRCEKFQRSGRSLSAPGSYDLFMDRLVAFVLSPIENCILTEVWGLVLSCFILFFIHNTEKHLKRCILQLVVDVVCIVRFYVSLAYKTKFSLLFMITLNHLIALMFPWVDSDNRGLLMEMSLHSQETLSGGLTACATGDDITRRSCWQQGEWGCTGGAVRFLSNPLSLSAIPPFRFHVLSDIQFLLGTSLLLSQ